MGTSKMGPGRPRKPDAASAAERMRASRERSLALHSLVARKLIADPALIDVARGTLRRWKANTPQPRPAYFAEWERILKRRPEEVAGFLVDMTEESTRLRQSSPFATLLTPEERAKVYAAFR
jgi:hypothetical protein